MSLRIHQSGKINIRLLFLIATIGLGAVLIAVRLMFSLPNAKTEKTGLLSDVGWTRISGATTTPEGLHVYPLHRVITHQDGSEGQPNPPVALLGPHLLVSGDFEMTATLRDVDRRASLRLYGDVPIVFDQWRYESASVNIDVSTSTITVEVWDGTASHSIDIREFAVEVINPVTLTVEHIGDAIRIKANNRILGSLPDHHIFSRGHVWFGLDAAPESDGWTLTTLNILPLHGGSVTSAPQEEWVLERDDDGLRALAEARSRTVHIGAAVSVGPMLSNTEYRKIVVNEFNMLTPENGMKPQFIHPERDTYVFEEMDILLDIATQNEIDVHGHALVYHKSIPEWMAKIPKEERQAVMLEHIETVAGHFRGRVLQWDVVNEPLSGKKVPYTDGTGGLEETLWYEAMGEEYIDLAFHATHKADPEAQLYLNDYGLERDGERWDALLALVKRLRERGVPIHGVGFESHIYGDGDYIDAEILKKHMDQLAELGLQVRISEIDVTGDDAQQQIAQYVLALDVCLRSSNCTGYSTWGVTDFYGSTTRSDRYPLVFGTSLLFDTELKPKAAYTALQARLRL